MVGRCNRLYHALEVTSNEEEELINAIYSWCKIHGPPQELIMDQETAIYRSAKARDLLIAEESSSFAGRRAREFIMRAAVSRRVPPYQGRRCSSKDL